jgi:hypothetical protein
VNLFNAKRPGTVIVLVLVVIFAAFGVFYGLWP